MTRTENDLREALCELDRRAAERSAPSTEDIVSHATADLPGHARHSVARRTPRWLPPLAAAAVVAAAAVTAVVLSSSGGTATTPERQRAGGDPGTGVPATAASTPSTPASTSATAPPLSGAASVLGDAAAKLRTASWTAPSPREFYYVRTNQATTWTSVSGTRAGKGRTSDGTKIYNAACRHGHFLNGESGKCTINDVPHYLADAPTDPSAWDAYLEHLAPGSKAGNAQGSIVVEVLHQDLTAPEAAAALLRYTETCPGLHTVTTRPVTGEKLIGVSCTSMSNGSYGLAFDAGSHAFVGFVPVDYRTGRQDGQAEIVRSAGVVKAIGDTP